MSVQDKKSSFPIRIYARQRPLTKTEIENKHLNVVQNIFARDLILKSGFNEKRYVFDHVFGGDSTQLEIYNVVVAPMINNILLGYNCTVFAYGHTGTGKTHTVFGESKEGAEIDFMSDTSVGLIPRASHHLFSELSKLNPKTEYTVRVSFVEIYNEEVRDLLNDSLPLRVYDDPLSKGSVCMKDISKVTVFNTQDVYDWLKIGLAVRQNAATNLNLQSSRSHVLFTFLINIREVTPKGEEIIKTGRLYLGDLAGSENTGRSGATDVRAREAGTINRSIITLGKVIKALSQKIQHIPYRDSKLTRILQDSLGGTTKTAMIATFSPTLSSWDDTNITLELAQMAKSIINIPQVNVNRKQANLLKELNDEISKLKDELSAARGGEGFYVSSEAYQKMSQEDEANNKRILELVRQIKEMEGHVRSLELQYHNLTDSFAKTKEYLEEREKVLIATQEALKQGQAKLGQMNLKHRVLSDAANTLLNICENSTKNEEIFHEKYQQKCVTTRDNAQLTNDMLVGTITCMDKMKNLCEESLKKTSSNADDAKQYNEFLRSEHMRVLHEMTKFSEELRSRVEQYELQMEEVFKKEDNDYCVKNVQIFVDEMYQQNLLDLEKYKTVCQLLNSLKEEVDAKVADLKDKSEKVTVLIQTSIFDAALFDTDSENVIACVKNSLDQRQREIIEQLEKEDRLECMILTELDRAESEEAALLGESSAVQQQLGEVFILIDSNKNVVKIEQAKELVTDYVEMAGEVFQPQILENVIQYIIENQNSLRNDGVQGREKIIQYLDQLGGTVDENLAQENDEFVGALHSWESKVANAQDVVRQARQNSVAIQSCLALMRQTIEQQNDAVMKDVDWSIDAIETLSDEVNPLGHAGDTPARGNYNFLKKTDLRREVLEARMAVVNDMNPEDESDKEN